MLDEIFEAIVKIPLILEFLIGSFVYFILLWVFNNILSDVAKQTTCQSHGLGPWLLCVYLTNPFISFISTVATIMVIGSGLRLILSR